MSKQPGMLIFAHRGASGDAPENTMPAFELGWQQGADGLECDVHLTRDGKIVCIHDANTRRTTGISRQVASSTWRSLRALDVGGWKGPRWIGTRLSLLSEVLEALPRDKHIQVEIKSGAAMLPRLIPLLRKLPQYRRRLWVIAFDREVLRALKRAAPDVRALWLTGYKRTEAHPRWQPTRAGILATLADIGADGLGSQSHRALTPELVRDLLARGLAIFVWTVDRADVARRMLRLGVDGIASNRPGRIRNKLLTSKRAR